MEKCRNQDMLKDLCPLILSIFDLHKQTQLDRIPNRRLLHLFYELCKCIPAI